MKNLKIGNKLVLSMRIPAELLEEESDVEWSYCGRRYINLPSKRLNPVGKADEP